MLPISGCSAGGGSGLAAASEPVASSAAWAGTTDPGWATLPAIAFPGTAAAPVATGATAPSPTARSSARPPPSSAPPGAAAVAAPRATGAGAAGGTGAAASAGAAPLGLLLPPARSGTDDESGATLRRTLDGGTLLMEGSSPSQRTWMSPPGMSSRTEPGYQASPQPPHCASTLSPTLKCGAGTCAATAGSAAAGTR